MSRQSLMPTGGLIPSSTSRMIPPPSAVAQASTITPNRSRPLRTATRPPVRAKAKTPTRSSRNGGTIGLLGMAEVHATRQQRPWAA